jgi:glycerol-3-phosphate dehydrogenase (NAD(P)+)
MSRIAIVGAGAWGTALAIHAARAGAEVWLTARSVPHPDRLPGFVLPASVVVSTEMVEGADAVLLCVPTQHLRETLARKLPEAPLLLCCKGIEARTGLLPLEVAGDRPSAVLTGPNFAAGIAAGQPAAAVVAGLDAEVRGGFIGLLATPAFRLYGNDDPVGAQLGGAAKNVIAIAAGAVIGAGYGENARAALITRGLAELSRLIVAQGGRAETAAGLSGLGDLVLTCTGVASRNFAYGVALGRGDAATDGDGPVVEGVATAPALMARAGGLDLPICAAVADLLGGRVSVAEAVARVLARPLREERA